MPTSSPLPLVVVDIRAPDLHRNRSFRHPLDIFLRMVEFTAFKSPMSMHCKVTDTCIHNFSFFSKFSPNAIVISESFCLAVFDTFTGGESMTTALTNAFSLVGILIVAKWVRSAES